MWLLVFVCVWTAECVPINQTQEATASAPVGQISLNDTGPAAVGEIPSNVTMNETTSAPGSDSVQFNPPVIFSPETVTELSHGVHADEGDILLTENRNAMTNVWMDATVPYVIDAALFQRQYEILEAFTMISTVTCIRFVPWSSEFNYIKFMDGLGCGSYVGCQGGEQPLYFSSICSVGNLCHEIIHALGLHHEHTRVDRDDYVTIEWGSIMKGKEKNFSIKNGNTLGLPYDLKSIMHYGGFFFSKDGSKTLSSKTIEREMGQRTRLSDLDIQKLNKLYHCDERWKQL